MKVKHIVQFQLKEELTEEQRLPIMQAFKAGIEALPATIPTIREIRVGFNINPAEAWHICLRARSTRWKMSLPMAHIQPTKPWLAHSNRTCGSAVVWISVWNSQEGFAISFSGARPCTASNVRCMAL